MKKKYVNLGSGIKFPENSKWFFDNRVALKFDNHVRQSIPFYENLQKYIVDISEWFVDDQSIIYDLGCSTGTTAKLFNKKFKNKSFLYYGLDQNLNMIKLAKRNNINNKKFTFSVDDITKFNFIKNSKLFISILTFPFLKEEEFIQLVKRIYNSLSLNGALIFVDKIRSSNSTTEDVFNQLYYDFKSKQKLKPEEILNKSKSLRVSIRLSDTKNTKKILNKVGFRKIETFFRWFNFNGYIAIK